MHHKHDLATWQSTWSGSARSSRFCWFPYCTTLKAAPSDVFEEARWLSRNGEWLRALARFEQLSVQQPDNPFSADVSFGHFTWLGDMKSRQQICKQILEQHWNTHDHIAAHELATELLANPDQVDDWSRTKQLSLTAQKAGIYPYIRSWAYLHVRMGQYEKSKATAQGIERSRLRQDASQHTLLPGFEQSLPWQSPGRKPMSSGSGSPIRRDCDHQKE